MVKSNADRQRLYRKNLSKDNVKFEQRKEKARVRDNTRRRNLTGGSLEQLRLRQKQSSKKYREKKRLERLNGQKLSSYKCRQSFGKAVNRVVEALPKSSDKRVRVVHHIAQSLNIIPKPIVQHKREQRSLSIELKELVINFYNRDDISYQLSGKRDCITFTNDDGTSTTLQKRILLYNVRETFELFLTEFTSTNLNLSLTSFNDLRPLNILTQSHMLYRTCLCVYHENMNLLLKSLSRYIRSPALNSLQQFSAMLVCSETEEKCMMNQCLSCKDNFNNKIVNIVVDPTQPVQWFQWILCDGRTKKIEFNGTIEECLTVMKEKVELFLTHLFIKRQQAAFFEIMKVIPNNKIICLQVDYSENFRLGMHDAVQSSYYSQAAVSLFTSYAWCFGGGQSFVFVSNNSSHDKYCIAASLGKLFRTLKQQFGELNEIHIFSDGGVQQFKQKFLLRNLCRLSEEYQIHVNWHYFATSHGKGTVDALGGTIKRLVYRAILSGQKCTSATEFVQIAKSKSTTIEVTELDRARIDQSRVQMEPIFQTIKPVPETKKIHSVKVLTNNSIEYRYYSNSGTKKVYRFLN